MNVTAPKLTNPGLSIKKNWGMFLTMFMFGAIQAVGLLVAQGFDLLSSDTYKKLYWEYQSIFMSVFGVLGNIFCRVFAEANVGSTVIVVFIQWCAKPFPEGEQFEGLQTQTSTTTGCSNGSEEEKMYH